MRARIGALALAAVTVAVAACGGGTTTEGAASGAPGTSAAASVPAVCVNVASLRTTVQQLTAIDATTAPVNSVRMAANNVATQTATFVSAAPGDLREAAKGLKDAVGVVRAAVGEGGPEKVAAAIAGVDTAWKELEVKLAAICPN